MEVIPLSALVLKKLKKYGLVRKHEKQVKLLTSDLYHPSLHVELLEPIRPLSAGKRRRCALIYYDYEALHMHGWMRGGLQCVGDVSGNRMSEIPKAAHRVRL